ncbi:MAG: hypothetical protein R3208_16565 [Ketobacteraceae bacterium]|nr:hypothetical protein [Ketobacteraceae bacterium]
MNLRRLAIALSIVGASTLGLTGCGGSSNDYPEIVSLEGTAIDGYLANAKVCVDSNRNRQCDQGEDFAMTDGNGDFEIETADNTSPLVLESTASTVDISDTPPSAVGEGLFLTAPNGSANITPLTTLAQIRSEVTGESYAASQTQVISDLGITGVTSLADFDYIEAQSSDDAATVTNATKAAATAAAVARVIKTNNQALAASTTSTSAIRSAVVFSLMVSTTGNTPLRSIATAVNTAIDASSTPDTDAIADANTPNSSDVEDLGDTIEQAEDSGGTVDTSGSTGGGSV